MLLYEIILDHVPFVVELLLCIEQRKQLQFIQTVHSIRFILSKHLLIINKLLLLYEIILDHGLFANGNKC